ncbi:MAG: hypothetical protein PUG55_04165 [Bacillales bacterium]|nr:hypothetical protein [Bacillales bacterium]
MRDKFTSLAFKTGLVLLIMNLIMLFFVEFNTPEWVITIISISILTIFEIVLFILIRMRIRKERQNENQ